MSKEMRKNIDRVKNYSKFINENNETTTSIKLKDLTEGKIDNEKYNIYFSNTPFKSLDISLKNNDNRGLFNFSCYEGSGRWLCGMTKTSYYQSHVYGTQFSENNSIDDVLKFVNDTLLHLKGVLDKNF